MATGSRPEEKTQEQALDIQPGGQSAGLPADGEVEGNAFNPLGNPGEKHWQAGFISKPGLGQRNNVFFAAIQMTRMPMAVTDPNREDNPMVFVNRAFLDLTGYEEHEVLGRNCRMLQGPDTDRDTIEEVRRALADHRAVAVDVLNYKADGEPFWNALFIGPVFDEDGRLLYWFSSQIDITRRRMSEQTYRQAQKMEAIGQLTAGLAHDFNNLLQVVTGNLEIAMSTEPADPVLRTALERANTAAEKGGRLTQQLLTFARKQRLEPKRINLNALIVEFSDMLVRTLGDGVELRLDLRPGLPACMLDPTHMEMALLNVLINARDAMPRGGRVTIGTAVIQDAEQAGAHAMPPGRYVMICVADEGEGMPPEVVRRATEPFFTTKEPGTGLGLAMVHGFVQQSHGRLEIRSEVGKGTRVTMIFPLAQERVEEAPPAARDEHPGQHTILLVEDSDDVREVTEYYLRSIGYRVLAAGSGEEALGILDRGEQIDLLFTDVLMPGGMNGLQLAERVRQRLPQLPVLLATGYMSELEDRGANTASMVILSKPYRHGELAERLRTALDKSNPRSRHFAELSDLFH